VVGKNKLARRAVLVPVLALVAVSLGSFATWRVARARRVVTAPFDVVARDRTEAIAIDRALESEAASARTFRLPLENATPLVASRSSGRAAITGRIVERGSKRAVARAAGTFLMKCESGTTLSGLICDDLGRFRIELACLPVWSLGISLSSPGLGRTVVDLAEVPSDGRDLGDLELEPASDVYFIVSTSAHAAVRGAVASIDGPTLIRSDPTAADGRGVLRSVLVTERTMKVEALGFETREVRFGDEATFSTLPLTVELARRPALRLSLMTRGGAPLSDAFVLVRCFDRKPFASDRGPTADPIQLELGAPRPRRRTIAAESANATEPRIRLDYVPGSDGKLCIPGLRPACPIEVAVEDKLGDLLLSRGIDPQMLVDDGEIVLRLDQAPTELALRAIDERGSPIQGAEISRLDARETLGSTDRSGIARIGPFYAEAITLVVAKSGCAPRRVSLSSLDSPLAHADVVLRPGRTVRVRVVDAHGDDATTDSITARFESHVVGVQSKLPAGAVQLSGGTSGGSESVNGELREFRDLPFEPFEWVVLAGGRRIAQACAPDADDVVITLPPFGSLDVGIAPPRVASARLELRVRSENALSNVLVRDLSGLSRLDSPAGIVHFPVVFPGRYTVDVREKNARNAQDDAPLARAIVDVRADETARVSLEPR
jgi:hypothetical protein